MAQLDIGYLFKKRNITFKEKEYEIFERVDYVVGISFINSENNNRFNIITGKYANKYASKMEKNENDEDLIFVSTNLQKAIQDNDNLVIFENIVNNKNSNSQKYYFRNDNGDGLIGLVNDELINFLNNEEKENEIEIATIYSTIKKSIIGQDKQIQEIISSLFKNQKIIEMNLEKNLILKLKENIFIVGPTGTGKTEIIKIFANLLNIPIIIENKITLEKKEDIEEMLQKLYIAAGEDMNLFKKGIIIIENIGGSSIQEKLGLLLDGETFYFNNIQLDTSTLTLILEKTHTIDKEKDISYYSPVDSINKKISKRILMNELSLDNRIQILKESELSPLKAYEQLFKLLNIDFNVDESFIQYVAEISICAKSEGAKRLKFILDEIMNEVMFKMFTGEYTGISLVNPEENDGEPFIFQKNENNNKHTFTLKK